MDNDVKSDSITDDDALFQKVLSFIEVHFPKESSDNENWAKFLSKYALPGTVHFFGVWSKVRAQEQLNSSLGVRLVSIDQETLEGELFYSLCRGYRVYIADKDRVPYGKSERGAADVEGQISAITELTLKVVPHVLDAVGCTQLEVLSVLYRFGTASYEGVSEHAVFPEGKHEEIKQFFGSTCLTGYNAAVAETVLVAQKENE